MSFTSIVVIVVFTAVAILEADAASKKEGKRKGIGVKGMIIYAISSIVLALLASWTKWLAVLISILLFVLAMMNREGKHRAKSWMALLAINGAMMIFSIVRSWDKAPMMMPKFSDLKLLIMPLAFIFLAYVKGKIVEDETDPQPSWWNRKKQSAES